MSPVGDSGGARDKQEQTGIEGKNWDRRDKPGQSPRDPRPGSCSIPVPREPWGERGSTAWRRAAGVLGWSGAELGFQRGFFGIFRRSWDSQDGGRVSPPWEGAERGLSRAFPGYPNDPGFPCRKIPSQSQPAAAPQVFCSCCFSAEMRISESESGAFPPKCEFRSRKRELFFLNVNFAVGVGSFSF